MSYHDLAPGERLRIVVPVMTSGGGSQIAIAQEKIEGNTITLSASNLSGYEVSEYVVDRRGGGKVELRFASAAITKDGKTSVETQAPKLPFALPEKAQYIRLLYLIRNSEADHNMAIVAARKHPALEAFTKRLKERPEICASNNEIFCTWVPAGIAVRPQAGAAAN